MDADTSLLTAPFRDPRYAPRRLHVDEYPNGERVLTNPTPFFQGFQTLPAAMRHWAEWAPDRAWLAERSGEGWRTLSFREAWEETQAIAGGLLEAGLISKRPLLILSQNAIDQALIKYAAMSLGMPVAPVSPQYGLKGANLARLTHACEVLKPAAVYVGDAELFADGLSAQCLERIPVIAAKGARKDDITLERLARARPAEPNARPDDHAKYLLTSGSTGLPKAVIGTHRNLALNSAQIAACFDDPDPPVMVHSAPWSHSLGANAILHQALHRGGTLYIDAGQPTAARFGETIRNLKEVSPTYQNMVPAGWMLLAEALEQDDQLARTFFERVRLLQYGGAALGQDYADRIQRVAIRTVGEKISFGSGYGATETGPTACNVHWPNERMGMIGSPIPGTSVRLVPVDGKLEFRVRGPQVSPGYLGQPELSAAAFDEAGFYRLGDAARFVDPNDYGAGMIFDGRLSENFKLASGTFVGVGELRIAAIGAIGSAVTDAVVCGEGEAGVGLLLYPNPTLERPAIEAAVRDGLAKFNAKAKGGGARVARALVLDTPPDAAHGEITDKGYIAQALARRLRAQAVTDLFTDPAPAGVMEL